MAEKQILIELDIDVNAAAASTLQLKQKLADLKVEAEKVKASHGELSAEYIAATAATKAAAAELRTMENVTRNVVTSNNAATGSINEMRAQLAVVTAQWNALSEEERNNSDEGKKLTEQKTQLAAAIRDETLATGDGRANVGLYSQSISEAISQTEGLGGAVGGAIGSVKGLSAQFKALLANPVVLVLAAIVGALKLLYDAFKSTQSGADGLNKLSATLSATWDALLGIIAPLAEKLVAMFKDPVQGIKDFASLIKENIINRFEGLLELIPQLGKAIGLLFKGEFSEAGKVATDAIAKVTLGVEDFTDKAVALYNDIAEAVEKSVLAQLKYENALIAAQEQIIKTTVLLAKLNKQGEISRAIADDNTRSFKERADAAEKARIASEEEAKTQLQLEKQSLNLLRLQVEQKKANGQLTRELRQQEADGIAKVIAAEKQLLLVTQENYKQREEISRDLFEKNLDYLLDNFDSVKTINEKAIADDKRAYEERLSILNATKQLGDASFNEQIKQLQTRTQATIDANDLINESDSKRLIEKVRLLELDEIEETRLLEVLRERRTVLSDLSEAEISIETEKGETIAQLRKDNEQIFKDISSESVFGQIENERSALEQWYATELEMRRKLGVDTTAVDLKYSNAKKAIAKAEFNAKLNLANGFLGNLASLAGEGTAIGKSAAAAQTAVSTYQAAMGAYSSLAAIPVVGPGLGIAAAAAATLSGLNSIRGIYATKSGLPGDTSSGGATVSDAASSAAAAPIRASGIDPNVNEGIISRDSYLAGTGSPIQLQPTLVTDNVTQAQKQNASNLKTSTI